MTEGTAEQPGPGRPRVRPDAVIGDEGYNGEKGRRSLRRRGISAVIPVKADREPVPTFDRTAYRERNVVERLINRLKQWRRIATRYEKQATNYRAMVAIAAILLWL